MNLAPYLLAFLLTGAATGCTDQRTAAAATQALRETAPPAVVTDRATALPPTPPAAAAFTTYRYEDDTLQQTVRLRKQGKGVAFEIVSRNKRTEQAFRFAGVAAPQPAHGDPEVDSDESGAPYPVDEYRLGGDCHLALRVEMEGETRVQIDEGDCDTFQKKHDAFTPFASVGVLKKQR